MLLNSPSREGTGGGQVAMVGGGVANGGDANNNVATDTTFQLDEDTLHTVPIPTPRNGNQVTSTDMSSQSVILRTQHKKQQKSKRKQRMSQSLSQPKFADHYRYTDDSFLGCGSYGSVYTCSSLKNNNNSSDAIHNKCGGKSSPRKSKQKHQHRDRSKSCVTTTTMEGGGAAGSGGGGGYFMERDHHVDEYGEVDEGGFEEEEEQEVEEEEFAVKIIDKEGHSRTRVFNEIEILHHCKQHPNIVQLLDFYEEETRFLLIFEKMNGGSLLDYLNQGPFNERESSLVTRDIATALMFLHAKGIAHRDLKPANVLCVYQHSVAPVKLCDFDLASAPWSRDDSYSSDYNSSESIDLMSPVGSAEYMAPEVVNVFMDGSSAAAYDKRCDLWSLGVILYIMLCGYPPFVGNCGFPCGWEQGQSCTECQAMLMHSIQTAALKFPPEQWDSVSAEAKHLVCSLLERDIHKRITAEQVLKHDWLNIASSAASDPIPLDQSKMKSKRSGRSGKPSQMKLPFIPKYRSFNGGGSDANRDGHVSPSPEDRQRLGTEDSGFGGEILSGVVSLLMEAVEDDEGNHSMGGGSDGARHDFFQKKFNEPDHQFELSDEESLFSSGYGVSLDLPMGEFKDRIEEEEEKKSKNRSGLPSNFITISYERHGQENSNNTLEKGTNKLKQDITCAINNCDCKSCQQVEAAATNALELLEIDEPISRKTSASSSGTILSTTSENTASGVAPSNGL